MSILLDKCQNYALPMSSPVNLAKQADEFYDSKSSIVHLAGLPFKATDT